MSRLTARVAYTLVAITVTGILWRWERPSSLPTTQTTVTVATTTTTILTTSTTSLRLTTATSVTLAPLGDGDLTGFSVAIDPGHNGGNAARPDIINQLVPDGAGTKACDTTGTETSDNFAESTFAFIISSELARTLRLRGASVVLTRSDNHSVGPCVNIRAALGNSSDVAISLHGDGAPSSGSGFTILTPVGVGPSAEMTTEANRLAGITRNQLLHRGISPSNYLGRDGIQPRSDLAGLNLSTTPKVMIECGNMKNVSDAANLTSAEWRQKFTDALADAVSIFLRSRS